jgi:hypothetical protein
MVLATCGLLFLATGLGGHAAKNKGLAATRYSIISRESPLEKAAPKHWTFQGRNDNIDWKTLDTRSDISFAGAEKKTFAFANTTPYRYYRLNVSANNGNPNVLSISTFKILATVPREELIDLNNPWVWVSTHKSEIPTTANLALCPAMTSDSSPSPNKCSASSEANQAFAAWKAFDNNGESAWATATGTPKGWLEFDFGSASLMTTGGFSWWAFWVCFVVTAPIAFIFFANIVENKWAGVLFIVAAPFIFLVVAAILWMQTPTSFIGMAVGIGAGAACYFGAVTEEGEFEED